MVSDEVIQIVTVLLLQIVSVPWDLLRAVFINESFTQQFLPEMLVIRLPGYIAGGYDGLT